jgi:hypothetical protein
VTMVLTLSNFLVPLWELLLQLSPSESVAVLCAIAPAVGAVRTCFCQMVMRNSPEEKRKTNSSVDVDVELDYAGIARELSKLSAAVLLLQATEAPARGEEMVDESFEQSACVSMQNYYLLAPSASSTMSGTVDTVCIGGGRYWRCTSTSASAAFSR